MARGLRIPPDSIHFFQKQRRTSMKISPLAAAALFGLLLPVSGLAQTSPRPDPSTPALKSTAKTADSTGHRHSVDGEVTKVDADKGWVDVKTPDGRMKLQMPSSALQKVKAGDRVTLEVGVSRGAPATR
jgi:hypothetical protein